MSSLMDQLTICVEFDGDSFEDLNIKFKVSIKLDQIGSTRFGM